MFNCKGNASYSYAFKDYNIKCLWFKAGLTVLEVNFKEWEYEEELQKLSLELVAFRKIQILKILNKSIFTMFQLSFAWELD